MEEFESGRCRSSPQASDVENFCAMIPWKPGVVWNAYPGPERVSPGTCRRRTSSRCRKEYIPIGCGPCRVVAQQKARAIRTGCSDANPLNPSTTIVNHLIRLEGLVSSRIDLSACNSPRCCAALAYTLYYRPQERSRVGRCRRFRSYGGGRSAWNITIGWGKDVASLLVTHRGSPMAGRQKRT